MDNVGTRRGSLSRQRDVGAIQSQGTIANGPLHLAQQRQVGEARLDRSIGKRSSIEGRVRHRNSIALDGRSRVIDYRYCARGHVVDRVDHVATGIEDCSRRGESGYKRKYEDEVFHGVGVMMRTRPFCPFPIVPPVP